MTVLPTFADVERAAAAIAGAVVRTPSAVSETLSELTGARVVVKFENLQFIASYKERGACNKLLSLDAGQRAAGVVALSAGNHAQAVARHATRLGIPATIVMPSTTPFVKVTRTRHLGAEVELVGASLADCIERTEALVAAGRTLVHPYDDAAIVAGQATVGLELLRDHPELDAVVCPVGGGGLLAGISLVAGALAPDLELVGVQTELYPSMARALAGDTTPVPGGASMADGIAVSRAGAIPRELLARAGAEVLTVTETAIEEAVYLLVEIEKVVSEGAGAAGLACLLQHRERFAGRTVGVVLTGGNIDPRMLASVLLRGLVHTGRLIRLRVVVDDRPGTLSRLTAVVGQAGGNIVDVVHQRLFTTGLVRDTDVELAIETMDREHGHAVVEALVAAGYGVEVR